MSGEQSSYISLEKSPTAYAARAHRQVCELIKCYAERKKMPYYVIALKARCHPNTLSRFMQGGDVNFSTAMRILAAIDAPLQFGGPSPSSSSATKPDK